MPRTTPASDIFTAAPSYAARTPLLGRFKAARSQRFCFVSRFGLAAMTGAARLSPALTADIAPRWS